MPSDNHSYSVGAVVISASAFVALAVGGIIAFFAAPLLVLAIAALVMTFMAYKGN